METRRAPEGRAHEELPWRAVRRWPGLRGEAKLAWRFLREYAGRLEATVVVTAADVGADQGTSERSGLRALESLALEGLIELVERVKGRWTVYLPDPLDVAKARRSRGCDGQGELFSEDAEAVAEEPTSPPTEFRVGLREPAADVAQHPPRRADLDLDFKARANKDLDLDFKRRSNQRAEVRSLRSPRETDGGSGATTAERSRDHGAAAIRLADVLPRLAAGDGAQQRPERRTDSAESYVRYLKERVGDVGDERKFESFALRVASLVFDPSYARRFDDDTVTDCLLALDHKRRQGQLKCAFAFFVGCVNRKLADQRLSWPAAKPGG